MIETNPTGILFEKSKNSYNSKLRISVKKREKLLYQEADFEFSILRPKGGWIESNEPEEHLDKISEDIESELKVDKSQQILCFSYKDTSLAKRIERLSRQKVNIRYLIGKKTNTIFYGCPEDYIDKNFEQVASTDEKADLIVLRHYLEHYNEKSNVLRGLSSYLGTEGCIYIEVPDCQVFITRRNPLFLWEQHQIYFTSSSLKEHIEDNGYDIVWLKKFGDNIEPSICALIKKKDHYSQARINILKDKDRKAIDYTTNIENMIKAFRNKWINKLCRQRKEVVVLGVGHNTDRFLQYTNTYKYIDHIVDRNPEKQGLYILNYEKQIESDRILKDIKTPVIISGCHDRAFGGLVRKLKKINQEAEILNIFGNI